MLSKTSHFVTANTIFCIKLTKSVTIEIYTIKSQDVHLNAIKIVKKYAYLIS